MYKREFASRWFILIPDAQKDMEIDFDVYISNNIRLSVKRKLEYEPFERRKVFLVREENGFTKIKRIGADGKERDIGDINHNLFCRETIEEVEAIEPARHPETWNEKLEPLEVEFAHMDLTGGRNAVLSCEFSYISWSVLL